MIADAVGRIKDTASSHRRAFLVEVMGRHRSYLALASGIITGAEMVLIPEQPAHPSDVAARVIETHHIGNIIIVAEGWKPGLPALQQHIADNHTDEGFDIHEVVLGHVQCGDTPTAFDRLLATRMGVRAVESLLDGIGQMVGLHNSASRCWRSPPPAPSPSRQS